jgi:hypothetical protein
MASTAVMAAVEARLAAVWTYTPIYTPNSGRLVPDDNSAFLAVEYPAATEEQISIGAPGANTWREEGGFRLALAIPAGVGLGAWPERVDELRAAFRGAEFGGVRTYQASPPAEDGETDNGAYYVLSIAVAYEFDIIG